MEIGMIKSKFELSVLGAIGIILLYYIIILGIADAPFVYISQIMYFKTHEAFQAIVIVSGEVISNIIMVILILRKVRGGVEKNFKVKFISKFNLKLLLSIIFLMSGYILWYQSSIGIVIQKIPLPQFIEKAFESIFVNPYSGVISAIIISPIFEEILMRGIILEGFLNKYKPRTAIIASALIFGLMHLNIPQFINATFLGLIFGLIYYRTRSLTLSIAAHMINNATAIILGYINFQVNIISFSIGILTFIIAGIFFVRYIKKFTDDKVGFEVDTTSNNAL